MKSISGFLWEYIKKKGGEKNIISSLRKQYAYIQGIVLISDGFITHEIAYNRNLSVVYDLIVYPWAETETELN